MQSVVKNKKSTTNCRLQKVSQLLAEAFIRLQEKSTISDNYGDNLVDLPATPSIHAGRENNKNIEV